MPDAATPFDIGRIIQLSVAPVFLLAGIGAFLNVMTSRLARVIDRARKVEEEAASNRTPARLRELQSLDRRMSHSHRAINLCVIAALLIALIIALLFVGYLGHMDPALPAALLFIAAMASLIGGLASLLFEISIATRTVRVHSEIFNLKSEAGDG